MRKPKVLYLMNSVGPTSIPLEIAEHIDEERYDVIVLSYYDCTESLEIQKIADCDIRIFVIGARRKRNIRAIFRFYRTMKKIAPDILHTHHNLSGSLGRLFAKCLRIPVIVDTEHSVPSQDLRYAFGAALLNGLTLGLADAVVFNSNSTKASLPKWISYLVKPEKERVIYNGVDIKRNELPRRKRTGYQEAFQTKRPKGRGIRPGAIESNFGRDLPTGCPLLQWLSKEQFVICNVGSLRPAEDQVTLIEALELIKREAHDVKLVIVGGGPLEEELHKEVTERNLTNDVWLAGEVCRDTVYRVIHACDVFVMTSLWEGFCVAVVEAMAARKPIIVTQVGALPEVVGMMIAEDRTNRKRCSST